MLHKAYAATDTCTWTGAVNGNWNVAGNWTGCDNGNLPENGDNLTFPASGMSNLNMTNNVSGLTSIDTITIFGSGYTLGGNDLTISQLLMLGSNNTVNLNSAFNTNSAYSIITSGSTNNIVNGNISLSGTGTFDTNGYLNSQLLINGVISGSASNVSMGGDGTLTIGTASWTYTTSSQVQVVTGATVVCNISSCFGNSTNPVMLTTTKQIELATPTIDIANPLTISQLGGATKSIVATTPSLSLPVFWSGPITLAKDGEIGAQNDGTALYIASVNLGGKALKFIGDGDTYQLNTGVISGPEL